MKLQHLRYAVAIADAGLNVTEAAAHLHTSQPGISKQVRILEEALGVPIFERTARRLVGITEPGKQILDVARRILGDVDNLARVAEEFREQDSGTLTVATTHTQARYVLPRVVAAFVGRYPKVTLNIREGSPVQIARLVEAGEADLAIATEALEDFPALVSLPAYQWRHCVIARHDHPIAHEPSPLTLRRLASYPLITYDPAFAGRNRINTAFERQGLQPRVALTAVDADVIKTYVGLGLGLGIVAEMAIDPERDRELAVLDASHLFEENTTRVALRRGSLPRRYALELLAMFSPRLTPEAVRQALSQDVPGQYDI